MNHEDPAKVFLNLILVIVAILLIAPFLIMIFGSFKNQGRAGNQSGRISR